MQSAYDLRAKHFNNPCLEIRVGQQFAVDKCLAVGALHRICPVRPRERLAELGGQQGEFAWVDELLRLGMAL